MAINFWDETVSYNENIVIKENDENNNIHYFISLQKNKNKDPLENRYYWDELYYDDLAYQGNNQYVPVENIQTNFSYLDDEDVYDEEQEYNKGDIVKYENDFYICEQDYTFGILPTNTSYWTKISEDEINELENNDYSMYVVGEEYNIGDIVKYQNDFYRCIENNNRNHLPTEDNSIYWVKCNFNQLDNDDTIEEEEVENESNDQLEAQSQNIINAYIAPVFSPSSYSEGDILAYNYGLHKCLGKKNPNSEAQEFDDYNWVDVSNLQQQIKDINNNLNNYVQTSTLNNYIQKTDSKYENFPNNWSMTTFNNFCLSLITFSTTNNNIGRVFLGDFPSSWISDIPKEGRAVIEILDENYIHLILYTNDLHKYEYLFDDTNNSGWF